MEFEQRGSSWCPSQPTRTLVPETRTHSHQEDTDEVKTTVEMYKWDILQLEARRCKDGAIYSLSVGYWTLECLSSVVFVVLCLSFLVFVV